MNQEYQSVEFADSDLDRMLSRLQEEADQCYDSEEEMVDHPEQEENQTRWKNLH